MAEIKIAVVANCQARPMARFLAAMSPQVKIAGITITHLAKNAQGEAAYKLYEEADFIFAQAVKENYPVSFLRTAELKETFGDKVVSWPNAFFKGHCPDICYITMPKKGRIIGPMTEYQSLPIFEAWQSGMGVMRTVKMLRKEDDWTARYENSPRESIQQLRSREGVLDIKLSDYLEERWRDERLFYTFNHPKKKLLFHLAESLLDRISVKYISPKIASTDQEPLSKIVPYLMPSMINRLGLRIGADENSTGCPISMDESLAIESTPRVYNLPELVETSFKCFDLQLDHDDEVRIT